MAEDLQETATKETLKRIIDNNINIPERAKLELKMIIESEHSPEKILQACLLYMLQYDMK